MGYFKKRKSGLDKAVWFNILLYINMYSKMNIVSIVSNVKRKSALWINDEGNTNLGLTAVSG